MTEKPKKPQQRKSKRLNLNKKKQWELILNGVDKREVPVTCLESITVILTDGTKVNVNISELINEGNQPDEVEFMINARLDTLNEFIEDIEYFINVDSVAKTIQPITDNILKNL